MKEKCAQPRVTLKRSNYSHRCRMKIAQDCCVESRVDRCKRFHMCVFEWRLLKAINLVSNYILLRFLFDSAFGFARCFTMRANRRKSFKSGQKCEIRCVCVIPLVAVAVGLMMMTHCIEVHWLESIIHRCESTKETGRLSVIVELMMIVALTMNFRSEFFRFFCLSKMSSVFSLPLSSHFVTTFVFRFHSSKRSVIYAHLFNYAIELVN